MSGNSTRHQAYLAQAICLAYLIVKPGNADGTCVPATAATEPLLGAADSLDKASGEMVDVAVGEFGEVRLGGTVTRGAWLTSNASARAIATTTAGNQVIGRAEQSGVDGDVIRYRVAPGQL